MMARNVCLTGLGLLCVGIGYVNIAIPGAPSTVFFLIALWAFSLGNPRLENWMLSNRVTGPVLRHWREHKAMRRKHKVLAISMLWAGILTSMAIIGISAGDMLHTVTWVLYLLLATAIVLTFVLGRIRTLEDPA